MESALLTPCPQGMLPGRRVGLWRALPGLVLACGLLFFSNACDQDPSGRQAHKLRNLQAQHDRLLAENSALRQRDSDLQDKLDLLKAEHENQEIQKQDLRRWNRELVRAYGPSVWKPGVYEYPLPYKSFKQATAEELLSELNRLMRAKALPEVQLKEITGAVAYVRIPQETMLTQQMGTTGARAFINAVAYTLCSLEQITCVEFEFRTGDHAAPGRLCP